MLKIYAIKDVKVSCFMTPYFSQNDISAQRSLYQALLQGESLLNQFSADYELYCIGEFDPQTGSIIDTHKTFIISCYTVWAQIVSEATKKQADAEKVQKLASSEATAKPEEEQGTC